MTTTLIPVTPTEGVNFNATYTAYNQALPVTPTNSPDNPGPPMGVGTVVKGNGNSEFVFVQATTTINLGDCCLITPATQTAAAITTTLATGAEGEQVGFAQVPIASGAFGWLQRSGACQNISVAAGCATDAILYTTASPGVLDDAVTTGIINGVVITATTTPAAAVPGTLNQPVVAIV
jgi:hypothetical protein